MEKEIEKLYYTIGEVADEIGVPTHTVRNLCTDYGITPARNRKGDRRFTAGQILILKELAELNRLTRVDLIKKVFNAVYPYTYVRMINQKAA